MSWNLIWVFLIKSWCYLHIRIDTLLLANVVLSKVMLFFKSSLQLIQLYLSQNSYCFEVVDFNRMACKFVYFSGMVKAGIIFEAKYSKWYYSRKLRGCTLALSKKQVSHFYKGKYYFWRIEIVILSILNAE